VRIAPFSDRLRLGLCRFHLDPLGNPKLIHANDQFLALLGLGRAEFRASPSLALDRIRPEDRAALREAGRLAARDRAPFRWDGQLLLDGGRRSIRLEASPAPQGNDAIIWEGAVLAIDDPGVAEADLETVLEAAQAYTWRRDLRERRSEFDARWSVLAGHPPGERSMGSDAWLRTVHPEHVAEVQAAVTALEVGAVERQVLTYRRLVRGGGWIWLQVHAGISERDAEGRPTALSGVSFDITAEMEERARAQQEKELLSAELAEARAALERTAYDLTEHITVGTYTMVLKPGQELAHFGFMSSRFLEITGLTRQEAQENPRSAFGCVHPEDFDEWVRKNERAFVNRERFREETRLLVDGKVRWVVAESVPRALEDGSWIWEGVIQDITSQKLAEQALQETTQALIESTRSRTRTEERQRILQDIHDGFGNQLAIGKLRLRRGAGSAAEVERILEDCLDDLKLLFASLDAEGDGLFSVLVTMMERLEKRVRLLPVTLDWDIEASADTRLEARAMLQAARIVQEAIANAVCHSRAGRIEITCHVGDGGDCLVIADDGTGFDTGVPQTGRGLANMRRRADEEYWDLEISSTPDGGGTRVRLCFS